MIWLVCAAFVLADDAWTPRATENIPQPPPGKKVYTLKDCLQRVKDESPGIREIRFNIEALDRRASAARALYLPKLTANGQIGYVNGSSTSYFSVIGVDDPEVKTRNISGVREYDSSGGQLTMPLIKDGSFFGLNKAPATVMNEMNTNIARYSGVLTEQQIYYNVTQTYLQVVMAKNKLDLLERQSVLAQKQLDMVKAQLPFGLATQEDVSAAELILVQNQNAADAATNLAMTAFIRMSMMLGIDDPRDFSIEIAYPPMPKLPSYKFLMTMINNDHPTIMKQQAVVQQAQSQLAYDQAQIWPTVGFNGAFTYADDLQKSGPNLWTGFVTINVPVFDFGVLHNTARSDLANVEAQNLQLLQTKDDLQQSLFNAYIAIRDNTYAAANINSQVATDRKAFQKMQVLQSTDAVTLATSISTEQAFITARLQQEDITNRHILSYAQLQSVVAGRWNWLDQPSAVPKDVQDSIAKDSKVKAAN